MTIVNNAEEFRAFYKTVYSGSPEPDAKDFPKSYPCICGWEWQGGGLMGEYRQIIKVSIPAGCNAGDFLKGFEKGFEVGRELF